MDCQTVLMTKTCRGSADGVKSRRYYCGRQYDLPVDLVKVFVEDLKVAVVSPADLSLDSSHSNNGDIAVEGVNESSNSALDLQQSETATAITPPWTNKTNKKSRIK